MTYKLKYYGITYLYFLDEDNTLQEFFIKKKHIIGIKKIKESKYIVKLSNNESFLIDKNAYNKMVRKLFKE